MNTFNRLVLILLCLGLVVAALAIITLTWTIPNRTINWLADAVQWMDDNDGDLEKTLLTTASAFVGLVAVIVLLIELLPRRGPSVPVTGLAAGTATLSAASISQRIEEAVVQLPNVSEVRADVKTKRKGVEVALELEVDPEANLATVTDEACQKATEVLTDRVHVALLRPPTARLHYRELRLHRANGNASRRSSRASTPTPVAAAAVATVAAPTSPAAETPAEPATKEPAGRKEPAATETAPEPEAEATQLQADIAEPKTNGAVATTLPEDTELPGPPELPESWRRQSDGKKPDQEKSE